MIMSPITSHLCLCCPQLNLPLKTPSWIILLNHSMPWSWVNTDYSIHWVLHIPRLTVSRSLPVLSLICLLRLLYPMLNIPSCMSQQMNTVSAPIMPPLWSIVSRSPGPKYYSNMDWWYPLSASPNVLEYSLKNLWVYSILAAKRIPKLARSGPPIASLTLFDYGIQVPLQTLLSKALKDIFVYTRPPPPRSSPNALNHGPQVQALLYTIRVWWNSEPILSSKGNSWDRGVLPQAV